MKKKLLIVTSIKQVKKKTEINWGLRYLHLLRYLLNEYEIHFVLSHAVDVDNKLRETLKKLRIKVVLVSSVNHKINISIINRLIYKNRYPAILFNTYLTAINYLPHIRAYTNKSAIIIDTIGSQWLSSQSCVDLKRDKISRKCIVHPVDNLKMLEIPVFNRADLILTDNNKLKNMINADIPNVPAAIIDKIGNNQRHELSVLEKKDHNGIFSKNVYRSKNNIDIVVISQKASSRYPDICRNNSKIIKSYPGKVNIIRIENNGNMSSVQMYNTALKEITATYGLVITDDTLLAEGSIDELFFCANAHPKNELIMPSSNIYLNARINEKHLNKYLKVYKLENYANWNITRQIYGKCFMIKSKLKDKIGLLDEKFSTREYACHDYCIRVSQITSNVVVDNEAFVYSRDGFQFNHDALYADYKLLLDKWGEQGIKFINNIGKYA